MKKRKMMMIEATATIIVENEEVLDRMFIMLVENFGVGIKYTTKEVKENNDEH